MPAPDPFVVLIGAPGAGKTRLGKRVAKRLGVPFIDTDKTIVAEHGVITQIFAEHGEEYFRAIEREHVTRAIAQRAVVALGGGAVLDPQTQTDLAPLRVAQITISTEAAADRLDVEKRPLLKDGMGAWIALVEKRKPIYDALTTRSFDTSSRPLDQIADEITAWIKEEEQ